ncbi:hypothetical protein KIF24_22730 [Micromonospora sp. Llam7]|nr:hypothetical protein [Micromonospora tarapacensis]MBX7268553.1 hypothetical protein [Micromonospora tarapacensis]
MGAVELMAQTDQATTRGTVRSPLGVSVTVRPVTETAEQDRLDRKAAAGR